MFTSQVQDTRPTATLPKKKVAKRLGETNARLRAWYKERRKK